MTSKYHIDHLAGVSIDSSFWVPVYTGITGILLGITPIVAQLVGAKKEQNVRSYIQQGFYIAFLLAFVVFVGIFSLVDSLILKMPLEVSVRTVAKNYLYMMAIGLVPLFLYSVLCAVIDAHATTRVSMFITLLSIPINIFLNYIFALFQLSDAIQAPVQGALRGYKDVNITFIMAIISYRMIIGLPTGYLLGTYYSLGPFGYCAGLIVRLTLGAITLGTRLIILQNKKWSSRGINN